MWGIMASGMVEAESTMRIRTREEDGGPYLAFNQPHTSSRLPPW